jgi:hypothetical protein
MAEVPDVMGLLPHRGRWRGFASRRGLLNYLLYRVSCFLVRTRPRRRRWEAGKECPFRT